jgi:hypothetical protein
MIAHRALLDLARINLDGLSPTHRGAYLLGCLIGQVRNGGFAQWVKNGYGLRLRETREAALAVGTEYSQRAAAMLADLEPHVDLEAEDRGAGGLYFKMSDEQRETYRSGGNVFADGEWLCHVFDERFHNFDERWEQEINAWLAEGSPRLKRSEE